MINHLVSWAGKVVCRCWEVNDKQANYKALNLVQDTCRRFWPVRTNSSEFLVAVPVPARVDRVYSKSWVFPLGNSSQWWEWALLPKCVFKFILVSGRITEPVSLHGNMHGLVLCSIFSAFALRYSLPPFWVLFQLAIPKPFMSIVLMNLCNPLSVFECCCPFGFSIFFHLSLKHPVCVSSTTLNLNLQVWRSSHCISVHLHIQPWFLSLCNALLFASCSYTRSWWNKTIAGPGGHVVHVSLVLWLCMTCRDYTEERSLNPSQTILVGLV